MLQTAGNSANAVSKHPHEAANPIGAGIGGLTATVTLAHDGWDVVVKRAGAAGGKLRTVESGGARIDCGPTVLTMRGIFDAIFARADEHLDAHLKPIPAEILRHAWQECHPMGRC